MFRFMFLLDRFLEANALHVFQLSGHFLYSIKHLDKYISLNPFFFKLL